MYLYENIVCLLRSSCAVRALQKGRYDRPVLLLHPQHSNALSEAKTPKTAASLKVI